MSVLVVVLSSHENLSGICRIHTKGKRLDTESVKLRTIAELTDKWTGRMAVMGSGDGVCVGSGDEVCGGSGVEVCGGSGV